MGKRLGTKIKSIFVNPSEEFVCVLGKKYVKSIIANKKISKAVTVLSDKRVYFRGKSFTRVDGKFHATSEERIIDVEDITGTGLVHKESRWILSIGQIILFVGIIMLLTGNYIEAVMVFFLSGFLMIVYVLGKSTLFEIMFAGGNISFDTAWVKEKEIQEFQRNIRLIKDTHKDNKDTKIDSNIGSEQGSNIADGLTRYADLLEQGLITRGEFDVFKAQLMTRK